eukprot:TRINITY_DN6059_c0_g1_i3.p1 TRINITY_DN6059_c0_g1~~TRINITY_DN6059_c0_g1_i3.p1  ORF type:complete len:535 (+),score=144.55 TRINITY_DN6059_c0_g1_i3:1781-3385(+)
MNPAQVFSDTVLVSDLVDQCVDQGKINWQSSSQLCDVINRAPYSSIEASKLVKTKLKNYKKPEVQLASVELMESLIKNCPHTHLTIGSKKYQGSIIKLVTNKKLDDRVRESLLNVIQNSASGFRLLPLQHQYHFIQTHLHLKMKGVEFPPEPEKPAFNPPYLKDAKEPVSPGVLRFKLGSSSPDAVPRNNHQVIPKNIPPAMTAEDMCKSTEECVTVLSEAITSVPPSELKENEIVLEMAANLKQYQKKIQEWIEGGSQSESNLASLLQANDSAETMLTLLDQTITESSTKANAPKTKAPLKPSAPSSEEPDLLGSFSTTNTPPVFSNAPSAPAFSPNNRSDSFGRLEPPPLNRTSSNSALNSDGTPKSRRRITPGSPSITTSPSPSPSKPQSNHQRIPSSLIDLSTPVQQPPSTFNQNTPTFETSTSFFPPVNFPPSPIPAHHFQTPPQPNNQFDSFAAKQTSPVPLRSPQQNLDQLFDELALDAFGPPSPTIPSSPQISNTINYPNQNSSWPNQLQPQAKQLDNNTDLLGLF